MRQTPEHWDSDHPAVRAWLDRPPTVAERTYAMRERRGIAHPTGKVRRVRLTAAFLTLFIGAGYVETSLGFATLAAVAGFALLLPDLWADLDRYTTGRKDK